MAGLPKKYAKMGFAKGWRAYKASKRTSSSRAVTRTARKRGVITMAKRRRTVAKRSYRKKSFMSGNTGLMLGGAGYGLIREPLNGLVARVPYIGEFGDEVALLGVSYLLATKTSGVFRQVGKAGLVIEAHNLARSLGGGMFGGIAESASPSSSGIR